MASIARQGDNFTTGHGCTGVSSLTDPSKDVFVDGLGAQRLGDPSIAHTIRSGRSCVQHVATITSGSETVFINGRPAARVGDSIDSGVIITGSPTVFIG